MYLTSISHMSVWILAIGNLSGDVMIQFVKKLDFVSYVRYLRSAFVICAASYGDDLYPRLINWKTNQEWTLEPGWYTNSHNTGRPLGVVHVRYALLLRDLLLILHRT